MSAKISTAVGAVGVTAAYVTHADTSVDDTETAVALSYSSDMGDITVGYGSSTGANDGTVISGAYTMALDADTSVSIGYGIIRC
jgi:tryptophan synthase alpha subunit